MNKLTGYTRKELRGELLARMEALDTSDCEFTNEELMSSFEEEMIKVKSRAISKERKRIFGKIIDWDYSGDIWQDIINFINSEESEQ